MKMSTGPERKVIKIGPAKTSWNYLSLDGVVISQKKDLVILIQT